MPMHFGGDHPAYLGLKISTARFRDHACTYNFTITIAGENTTQQSLCFAVESAWLSELNTAKDHHIVAASWRPTHEDWGRVKTHWRIPGVIPVRDNS